MVSSKSCPKKLNRKPQNAKASTQLKLSRSPTKTKLIKLKDSQKPPGKRTSIDKSKKKAPTIGISKKSSRLRSSDKKKLSGKELRLKCQERSAKLMEKFLSTSGTRPKPQSKASAKIKDVVNDKEEEDCRIIESSNNNNNNNNNNKNSNNNNNNNNNNNDLETTFSPQKQKIDSEEEFCISPNSVDDPYVEYDDDAQFSTLSDESFYDDADEEIGIDYIPGMPSLPSGSGTLIADLKTIRHNIQVQPPKRTQFECKICSQMFPNRYFHRKHMLREHEDQLYECRVCSFNSVHPEKLKNHIIKLHVSKKEKPDQSSPSDLQEELESLIEKKIPRKVIMEDGVALGRDGNKRMRFICALCSRRYSSKYALERHVRCHTLEKPYHCDVCDFSSSYKEHMMRHITSVHLIVHSNEPRMKYVPKKKRPTEENEDGDENLNDADAKKRRNILRKRFECAVCGLKATHKMDLMAHIRDKHPNAHIESLKNNDGSKVHLIVTVAKKPKISKKLTIQCTYCSLIFHDTWKYKVHLRSHTGVKPFRCSICSFRATSKMTVRDHIHRKHSDLLDSAKIFLRTVSIDGAVEEVPLSVPWREFRCEHCGELKEDNYNLKLHKQREHKDALPFSCLMCDHKSLTKASMIKHCVERHEKESISGLILHYGKPAKMAKNKLPSCEFCNKVFAYQSQLNLHLKLHTGEKTFHCDHCQYKTNSKNLLTNHLLKLHFGTRTKKEKKSRPIKIKSASKPDAKSPAKRGRKKGSKSKKAK